MQTGSESPAMGRLSLPLHQSSAHPWSPEPRGGHAFEERDSPRRVGVTPRVGSDNLEPLREVDLFATSEKAHCPLFFSLSHSPLEGDALTSCWPAAKLYAFPPIQILPLVLCKINQPWFPDLTELLVAPPWPIPIRTDLLSQIDGSVWHPNAELWSLHL